MQNDFNIVTGFENKIASFFGSQYAIAVDSCTHGLELCIRLLNLKSIKVPVHTYLSVPFLADKLNIKLEWEDDRWNNYYYISERIIDAAVLWKNSSYINDTFMCLSFQYQKHLSLGRGGIILTNNKLAYNDLKKMSYDGRIPNIPWREQNIASIGYHYYMTPETAQDGLNKLNNAIMKEPKLWSYLDYPDLTEMDVFKKRL